MSHDAQTIIQLLGDAPIGTITSVEPSGSGYASAAYKVVSDKGTFIALTQKSGSIAPPNYAYHFAILQTLESIKYPFAPKAIYIDPQESLILMSQVGGQPFMWVNDAPEDQQKQAVKTLVTALLDLRDASFSMCAEVYHKLSGKELETTTLQKNVQLYMTDWLKLAQTGQPDPELTSWVKPKVAACEAFAAQLKPGKQVVLGHGDTSEGNILLTDDLRLHLIDWDSSSFNQFPDGWDDFGVAYLMNHVPLFQKFRPLVTGLVSERCGLGVDELENRIFRQQENIKLGDIMWAYMMHARAQTGEIQGKPDKFMAIARARIDDYEKTFAANSFLLD